MGRKRGQEEAGAAAPAAKAPSINTDAPATARAHGSSTSGLSHYMCHIQVLASDVEHNSPSLMLVLDRGGRYMFNAGEGLQRLMREKKIRMNKLEHYMFTRVGSETMAGLPGMLLSTSVPASDAGGLLKGQDVCSLIGPLGVQAYVHAFKSYVNNEQTLRVVELPSAADSRDKDTSEPLHSHGNGNGMHDDGEPAASVGTASGNCAGGSQAGFRVLDPVVENEWMTVVPVTISPAASSGNVRSKVLAGSVHSEGPVAMEVDTDANGLSTAKDSSLSNAATTDAPPPTSLPARVSKDLLNWAPSQDAACYVCELRGLPGKFDPQRANALDVPNGKERGELQRGNAVTLLTGRVVEPHEVLSPGVPGPCLAIIDCPSLQHLQVLTAEAGPLAKWTDEAQAEAAASTSDGIPVAPARHRVMAHFSPAALVASAQYQAWLQRLGPSWRHIMCFAGAGQKTTLMRASVLQAKLHCLHPGLFPSLHPPWRPGSEVAAAVPGAFIPQPPTPAAAAVADVNSAPDSEAQEGQALGKKARKNQKAAAEALAAAAADVSSSPAAGQLVLAPNACRYHLLPLRIQGVDSADVSQDYSEAQVCTQFESMADEVIQMARKAAAPPDGQEASMHEIDPLPEAVRHVGRNELEVVFLGTVSSVPSKFRNVTSIYLDRFHRGGLLLDCGEDTLGQLKRRYGAADTERRILELGCVWVSHMHADHHGGLARLLTLRYELVQRRKAELQLQQGEQQGVAVDVATASGPGRPQQGEDGMLRPLLIIGPLHLFKVLANFREVLRMPFHFLPNHFLDPEFDGRPPAPMILHQYHSMLKRLQLRAFTPFPVLHVGRACGIRVEGEAGWKVVFSGDTRPAPALVRAAKQATLLIHEATFEDDKQDEAIAKNHSTTGEAISVAQQAGAYRTILTHFSTRYPTIPAFSSTDRQDIAIAMDFMTVNLLDLPWLPRMVAPLDVLFKREEQGWQDDEAEGPVAGAAEAAVVAAAGKVVKDGKGGAGGKDSKQGKGEGKDKKGKQQVQAQPKNAKSDKQVVGHGGG